MLLDIKRRLKRLENLVAQSASSFFGNLVPWTPVAPDTALAASLLRPNLAADSSGAQSTIMLPSAAQMANVDGFEFTVKATGAMVSPVIVAAGAGTTVELLNDPGTFGASTWLPIQGQAVVFKYDKATTTFKARATSEGSGAAGTSAYNPTWYAQTDIYWDPQEGVDSNSGALGSPVATPAEILRRWGGIPTLLVSTTVHQLSSDLGATRYNFRYVQGAPGVSLVVVGTPILKGAPFAAGAVTAISRANPGNDMLVAGFPGGAAVGDLVHNTTLNTYAWIDAIGGGTATLTPPFNPPPSSVQGAIWVAGNTLQLLTPPNSNIDVMENVGGSATNPGDATGSIQPQLLTITDSSGGLGNSVFTLRAIGGSAEASGCNIQSFAVLDMQGSPGFNGAMANCFCGSGGEFVGSGDAGAGAQNATFVGGRLGAAGFDSLLAGALVRNDCIVRGTLVCRGYNSVAAHLVNLLNIQQGRTQGGSTGIWGAGTIDVLGPSAFTLSSTFNTFANLIKVAALEINAGATASTYTGAGVNADGVAITSATIDANGAMFNVKTGGRYAVTTD